MLDLDAIEARAEAATPGDHWFADLEPEDQLSYEVWAAQDPDEESSNGVVTEFGCKKADAYFIASARADIPAMVAELRAAREAKERVLDMHSSNSGGWCWECAHPSPCRTVAALAAYRAVVGEA
jgi:hypothetical protein